MQKYSSKTCTQPQEAPVPGEAVELRRAERPGGRKRLVNDLSREV